MTKDTNHGWYFDLLGAVIVGLLIGFFRQKIADSGEVDAYKIATSMFLASCSYISVCLLLPKQTRIYKLPRWVWVALLGSVVCFLSIHVVKYLIDNWVYRTSDSLLEYLTGQLPDAAIGLFIIVPIYSLFALFIMATIMFIQSRLHSTHDI